MVFNTATVSTAITPVVVETFFSHFLNRKPRAKKPTAHISYDEGINLIRKFLLYASHHTVEDIQRFTSQWVPHPTWVKVDSVLIPPEYLSISAEALQAQLGREGVEKVGGNLWWQWRRPGGKMKAEWIEMRSDYLERKKVEGEKGGKRVMLYVHGGAYFFGSVDEHRYQMQRHARKLKARVFAREYYTARYRLAPQFPFPCGLHDCLAAYMYLLSVQDPTTIILAGDSAGGGMIISMLVTIRDQGIPMPAGAILISPWVDLTHSFPSVSDNNPFDYIPAHGFHQRPSASWPPNTADMLAMEETTTDDLTHKDHFPPRSEADAVQGFHVDKTPPVSTQNENAAGKTGSADGVPVANTVPGPGRELSIMLDGNLVQIKDQIQMYATNQLISHPLVSPVLQPSLGGLPPLLILVGGGEMLRDEQIYLAHKAANPKAYPPGDAFLDAVPDDHLRDQVSKWKGTDIQLQIWEDLCHVAPTLSWTRPAKYMYRSIAQFGAWALARAQKSEIVILDDDDVSIISKSSSEDGQETNNEEHFTDHVLASRVGKAGDPLPPFRNHMIRQRVDRHGNIYPLEAPAELRACMMSTSDVGVIKEGPVKKWITAKKRWDTKFAAAKRKIQKQRAKEMVQGYQSFGDGEVPPPSALAGRRKTGEDMKEEKHGRSWGMSLWSIWGSKHDKMTMDREQEADKEPETTTATAFDGAGARPLHDVKTTHGKRLEAGLRPEHSRSRSGRRSVRDEHQTDFEDVDEDTPAAVINAKLAEKRENDEPEGELTPEFLSQHNIPAIQVVNPADIEADLKRPKAGGIAFPFSLKLHNNTASMTTLTSAVGVPPTEDVRIAGVMHAGLDSGASTPRVSREIVPSVKAGEEGRESENHKGKGPENWKVVGMERPPLETFETAQEEVPIFATHV